MPLALFALAVAACVTLGLALYFIHLQRREVMTLNVPG